MAVPLCGPVFANGEANYPTHMQQVHIYAVFEVGTYTAVGNSNLSIFTHLHGLFYFRPDAVWTAWNLIRSNRTGRDWIRAPVTRDVAGKELYIVAVDAGNFFKEFCIEVMPLLRMTALFDEHGRRWGD